jgi:hypothetical protein
LERNRESDNYASFHEGDSSDAANEAKVIWGALLASSMVCCPLVSFYDWLIHLVLNKIIPGLWWTIWHIHEKPCRLRSWKRFQSCLTSMSSWQDHWLPAFGSSKTLKRSFFVRYVLQLPMILSDFAVELFNFFPQVCLECFKN